MPARPAEGGARSAAFLPASAAAPLNEARAP